jgi:hypothetical protein
MVGKNPRSSGGRPRPRLQSPHGQTGPERDGGPQVAHEILGVSFTYVMRPVTSVVPRWPRDRAHA